MVSRVVFAAGTVLLAASFAGGLFHMVLRRGLPALEIDGLASGREAVRTGDLRRAFREFGVAAAIDPASFEAQANLGDLLAKQGRVEEALARYQRALALQPGLGLVHYNAGVACARLGRFAHALHHFERASALGVPQAADRITWTRQRLAGAHP